MQTFVPISTSFAASLAVLDYKRLGKQRVEALTIYNTIRKNDPRGWGSHPIVRMWKDNQFALLVYGLTACNEWKKRGYVDNIHASFIDALVNHPYEIEHFNNTGQYSLPWWWGDDRVHSSHRASLLMKDRAYYKQFGWHETPKSDYFWPIKTDV
jgi:hypothetical protein